MRRLHQLAVPLALGAALCVGAASATGSTLFESTETLRIRIEAPWRELTGEMEAGKSAAGRLSLENGSEGRVSFPITITTRGLSRIRVCEFPLLTLDLETAATLGPPWDGLQFVHLTTQCRGDLRSRDHLELEYLSYQAYRLLDQPALGARMAFVEYLDTDGRRSAHSPLAFLVEDLHSAAARSAMLWLEPPTVAIKALSPDALAMLGLFQFMLGNTDWSVLSGPPGYPCCHNVAIFGPEGAETDLIPVPFDLDSTGLVDPPYAAPAPGLPIQRVRQRLYRGFCEVNPNLPQAIERLQSKRSDLLALFEESVRLSPSAKRSARRYLEGFFEILEDPRKLERQVLQKCR